ncbi:MAG: hypothetical protein WDO13_04545 [Verrucomicrobiota bacterium]
MLLAWMLLLALGRADPPDVTTPSPDGGWVIEAKWTGSRTGQAGYVWTLKNLKTSKVFFIDKPRPDEVLPARFRALWSPGSHYVALDLFYGRKVTGVTVVAIGPKPEIIDPLPNTLKPPLEQTLIKPEDLPAWDGSGLPITGADAWLDDATLSIDVTMDTALQPKGGGRPTPLSVEWHKTVRFTGTTPKVIDSVCDSYDKGP